MQDDVGQSAQRVMSMVTGKPRFRRITVFYNKHIIRLSGVVFVYTPCCRYHAREGEHC